MKLSIGIRRAFCLTALIVLQLVCARPSAAQTTSPPYQSVRIQVYVFDASNGTAVPGENVYYEESGGQYCKGVRPLGSQYIGGGATGGDGCLLYTSSKSCSGSPGMAERTETSLPSPSVSPCSRSFAVRRKGSQSGHFSTAQSSEKALSAGF